MANIAPNIEDMTNGPTGTPVDPSPAVTPVPMAAANENHGNDNRASLQGLSRPPHTHTESTLAPTSEFMRYFLAAYPARYIFRGFFRTIFDEEKAVGGGLRNGITRLLQKPGEVLHKAFGRGPGQQMSGTQSAFYNASLGIGSLGLTLSYSWTVYKDIKNLFCETVGEELGKPYDQVNFNDIRHSKNKIVQQTLDNFGWKMLSRLATDALFIPATLMRKEGWGDAMLGLKGVQLFADTWKRKTTMFEDFVTFVNNKINPRNGLGQPIAVGEVFDLYQHYAERFHPDKMFSNVLERGTGEGARWAETQPIFQRLTDLMNETYAYKHRSVIDPATGHAVRQADFTLPKFIYLLGSDLIDTAEPQRTLAMIEIANRDGIPAVKQAQAMFAQGVPLEQVLQKFSITLPTLEAAKPGGDEKNGVIAKGSTVQLDHDEVPVSKIAADSIAYVAPERNSLLRE
jgi:hypothetical protein